MAKLDTNGSNLSLMRPSWVTDRWTWQLLQLNSLYTTFISARFDLILGVTQAGGGNPSAPPSVCNPACTVRAKKTAPKPFNTIPFRYNNERTIWNGNVAQRYFIPFRLVSFRFVLFSTVQRGELLQEARADYYANDGFLNPRSFLGSSSNYYLESRRPWAVAFRA